MAEGEHGGTTREHWGAMREQGRAARERGEQRESTSTKRSLAGEQRGGTLVSDRSRAALGLGMLYIYIIHLELRIGTCRFCLRKGAGPL